MLFPALGASLIAQLVIPETLVPSLGREDPLEKERLPIPVLLGFPGGSAGKESACNVGDPGLIPGLGRSPAHSSVLAWRIPWTVQSMGVQRVRHG